MQGWRPGDQAEEREAGVARPKRAKHQREPASAAATLDDIESLGDRLAAWIGERPLLVLGTAAALLAVASGIGLVRSSLEDARVEASAALASIQRDFRLAMGASADDVVVGEPANPATAERVRSEYLERFREVAERYPDAAAGALAGLEVGVLEQALGRPQEALETWQASAAKLGSDDLIRAFLDLRIAAAHETELEWIEAGEAFERAAAVERFPLRYGALADAARCFAEAGEADRALATFTRVETEAPDFYVPEHLSARLRELKASLRVN